MNRKLFQAVQEYKLTYGKVPTLDVLHKDYPTVTLPDPDEYPLAYLIDQMRENRRYSILADGVMRATELLNMGESAQSVDVLAQSISQVHNEIPRSIIDDLTAETLERRRAAYAELRKRDSRLLGIPSGFHSIDEATQGFKDEQLITMVGLPKSGKSTLLLLAAMTAHQHAFRPLVVGFEMSNPEQRSRHAAFLAKVSHQRLRTGNLTPAEYKRLERSWRMLEAMPEFFVSSDISSATTLSGLQAQIERCEPDIVFVDGVYLMRDEQGEPQGSPQAITNITRGMKRLAQSLCVPIVQTTQALSWKTDKRRGVTSDSIGYSSSFLQDSDLVVGVEKTEIDDINKIKILDGRDVRRMEKYVRWDWDTGTFEELDHDPFAKESQEHADGQSGFA
jgi:replicative DNA helicase